MTKPIFIKEYSELSQDEIKDCNLDKLQSYLKCRNLESAIKITRQGIETKSWVGVIKYKKFHLEILPKLICKEDNNAKILNNLLFMLSYTKNLNIKINDNAKLSKEKNPFLEILIKEFANSLFEALKKLTPKNYIQEEDNLTYPKGKINFAQNIRYNITNQAKFYCEFDEFSENNTLNQLFLFVSTCLFNISNNSQNKKTLKFIKNYYSDIKLVKFDRFKVEKIKLTRNQELFKKPFNLAKMFIEQTSVDLSKNKFENITLLWDMNKLFEEFIYRLIKKELPELNPKAQKGKKLLNGNHRNTYIDIFLDCNNGIVLDTKYKIVKNSNNFSNNDVYQVSTYCLIHGINKTILLYPQYENAFNEESCLNSDIKENRYKIKFCTIDLQTENLKKQKKNIIDRIGEIIKFKDDI